MQLQKEVLSYYSSWIIDCFKQWLEKVPVDLDVSVSYADVSDEKINFDYFSKNAAVMTDLPLLLNVLGWQEMAPDLRDSLLMRFLEDLMMMDQIVQDQSVFELDSSNGLGHGFWKVSIKQGETEILQSLSYPMNFYSNLKQPKNGLIKESHIPVSRIVAGVSSDERATFKIITEEDSFSLEDIININEGDILAFENFANDAIIQSESGVNCGGVKFHLDTDKVKFSVV
jgi:hypothetical protein